MLVVDKGLIKRLKKAYPDCPASRMELRDAAQIVDKNGRLKVAESIKECGYMAVLLVLADTIKAGYAYDSFVKGIACQLPVPGSGYHVSIHPAYLADIFLQQIRINLVEVD